MITRDDVEAARERTAGLVRRTPVTAVAAGDLTPDTPVLLKLEQLQHTGSFKARGALNRVLAAAGRGELGPAGVVAASGGNAGLAVAYAAARQGAAARVYVPTTAPAVKVARLRELGADVVGVGDRYALAYEAAVADAERTGALFCHAYDQPEVCAGQGTLALELLDQVDGGVDTVLVAVGGGGLMAGVAAALEGRARVVGVEPRTVGTFAAALAAGEPVDVPVSGVAADSLGATRLGAVAWAVAGRTGAGSVLVDDADVVAARLSLWEDHRLVVEHGAASVVAALRCGAYRPEPGERVVAVLCGANTAVADLTPEAPLR
ncbi:threonine/serine dehydratase [Geodermatophilus sp. DSM 44513]|uniref:threonine/serine dehydratase n=1 Tax=Geodermatophilus sp. DSM 44513 TaxID=1528104 RepID=UPI0028F74354|nr:threonine/serine dehydratase [Geodermatophilus sp. DSM 44513]WNV74342.1 threonine/serine dehydratase [Geodermatophilus sp. DSM 44513]